MLAKLAYPYTGSANIDHAMMWVQKSPIFVFILSLLKNGLYYHSNIFTTIVEFSGLSSAVYWKKVLHSKWKILANI